MTRMSTCPSSQNQPPQRIDCLSPPRQGPPQRSCPRIIYTPIGVLRFHPPVNPFGSAGQARQVACGSRGTTSDVAICLTDPHLVLPHYDSHSTAMPFESSVMMRPRGHHQLSPCICWAPPFHDHSSLVPHPPSRHSSLPFSPGPALTGLDTRAPGHVDPENILSISYPFPPPPLLPPFFSTYTPTLSLSFTNLAPASNLLPSLSREQNDDSRICLG